MSTADMNSKIMALNKSLLPWAVSQNSTESPIWVADLYDTLNPSTDLVDIAHPNAAGNAKMAAKYLEILKQIL